MIVSIEYVKYLKSELANINKSDLDQMVFTSFGDTIEVEDDEIEEFLFTGLSNVDFIMSLSKRGNV